MNDTKERGSTAGYVALAFSGALWGASFVFGKWALEELSVGHMVLLRFLFACAGLAPAMIVEHRRHSFHLSRADAPLLLAAAVLGVPVQFLVQFEGLARTTVSHAAIMIGALPLLLAAGAALCCNERLDKMGWAALTLSTVGVALVSAGGGTSGGRGPTLTGNMLVLGSLVASAAWMLMSRALMNRGWSAVMATGVVFLLGAAILAVWVILTEGIPPVSAISSQGWLSLAGIGLLTTTVTTLVWNWGLVRVPASRGGVFANLEPVVGAILGIVIFHDALSPLAIGGGVLIIVTAVLITKPTSA